MTKPPKKKIWLTYSWDDNKQGDVDAIAQSLEQSGLIVEMDKKILSAGKILWEDIAEKIEDPTLSGWVIYATQSSLRSSKCVEELHYALHQSLKGKKGAFPIIGLFPSSVDESLIPLAIKIRLYVRMKDPDWKERIVSSIYGKVPAIENPALPPYHFNATFFRDDNCDLYIHEMRPRGGTWSPFVAAIEMSEREKVKPFLIFGPANNPNIQTSGLSGSNEGSINGGKFWGITAQNEASPTQSYYLVCANLPTKIIFGQLGGALYKMDIDPSIVEADLERQMKGKGLNF